MSRDVNPEIQVEKEEHVQMRGWLPRNAEEPEDADERGKQENAAPKTEKPGTPPPKTSPAETPSQSDQTNVKASHSGLLSGASLTPTPEGYIKKIEKATYRSLWFLFLPLRGSHDKEVPAQRGRK
ncbi:hypothetical protein NDU88_007781 [Pleurodeles waltl]|uniref:Uncharacterized protein n=1 Tax=Pleurodeles waltl TaxID=8319 RepID=A0AAV7RVV0_PLEWA|nr:hypothetical protein NDU88_007781 [Pleurodeles waltl]